MVLPVLVAHGVAVQRQAQLADWTRHTGFRLLWSQLASGNLYPGYYVGSLLANAELSLGVG